MAASGRIRRAAAVAATAILVLALGVGLAAVTRPEASTAERRVARVPAPAGPALANLPRGPKIPALIQKPDSAKTETTDGGGGIGTGTGTGTGTGGGVVGGGTTTGGGTAG